MESKGLGLFLILLGGIIFAIALITIWSMFVTWISISGVYIILSIPFLVFSSATIFFGLYLYFGPRMKIKVKGIILIIVGIIPIISALLAFFDPRLSEVTLMRFYVLFPLALVGVYLIIYGCFLLFAENRIHRIKTKKITTRILGLIGALIGIVNIVFFILLLIAFPENPWVLSLFWLAIGIILSLFGANLLIKKVSITQVHLEKR